MTARRFRVRLTAQGGPGAIDGLWTHGTGDARKVHVAAPPEDSTANASIGLLLRALDVRTTDAPIALDALSRVKRMEVVGDDALLTARLVKAAP